MGIEAFKNFEQELREEFNEMQNEVLRPGRITYLRESYDKKYNIYAYKLNLGGNRGGIKNKYEKQIGKWIEGTKFTDQDGKEITKQSFKAGEIVYLKVPKKNLKIENKETTIEAGKVKYLGNRKENNGCNWKYWSYTFVEGGNKSGASKKFREQLKKTTMNYELCDKDGNPLKKDQFKKGETVYYKEPNLDVVDSRPEMTAEDISKLTDNEIRKLFKAASLRGTSHLNGYINHRDKYGFYSIINGKKIYTPSSREDQKSSKPMYYIDGGEGDNYTITIYKKVGNEYRGIHYDGLEDIIYRGRIRVDGNYGMSAY